MQMTLLQARLRSFILFAGQGLVSGALLIPLGGPGTELEGSRIPALPFGAAICLALYLTAKPKWPRLVIAFLAVQLAWQAAVSSGIFFYDQRPTLPKVVPVWAMHSKLPPGEAAIVWPKVVYDRGTIISGLIGGAIGATGTWLGAAFCAAGLRTLTAWWIAVLIGALAGLFLGFGDSPALFLIWQPAVAASLGFWIPARGNASAPVSETDEASP